MLCLRVWENHPDVVGRIWGKCISTCSSPCASGKHVVPVFLLGEAYHVILGSLLGEAYHAALVFRCEGEDGAPAGPVAQAQAL